jgi:hypothetical protein
MTRTVTHAAVKRVITRGLTGWQAGKLVLQDLIDGFFGKDPVLSESYLATIRSMRMEGGDVRNYNMFMALCRSFHAGYMLAQWSCTDACLQIEWLDRALENADRRRTVGLFESFGPHVVTPKQYEEIVAAQKEKKLDFEFGLGYVIEERFYAIAPPEAKTAINELGVDIESLGDLIAAVPEAYDGLCGQAIDEIRRLCTSGKLSVVYSDQDAKEVRSSLRRWKKDGLSSDEAVQLVDRFSVTGRALCGCRDLPEWKSFIDEYQRHWFDDDERFRHAYAVLGDCPVSWLDKHGSYRGPEPPSDWITHGTESMLGLSTHEGKAKKSIKRVGAELRDHLDTAEQNIRMFMAIKAVLDSAADAVDLEVPGDASVLAGADIRLNAFTKLYNIRLEELREEETSGSKLTRLEKALLLLPSINLEQLKPSVESLKRLQDGILEDARDESWLRTKARSLEYPDGVRFDDVLN